MSNPSTSMPPLTLIVATTPTLGIGLRGSLPWPPLKSDLAFFARVTKRPPPPFLQSSSTTSSTSSTTTTTTPQPNPPTTTTTSTPSNATRKALNAVIMGRKTWDSIPPKFRPLKDRVNVVISRNPDIIQNLNTPSERDSGSASTKVIGAGSIKHALQVLQEHYGDGKGGKSEGGVGLGRVFVIGGASIYEQAMSMGNCERILWTRVRREFECDVFFPAGDIFGEEEGGGGNGDGGWRRKSKEELRAWSGEEGAGDVVREGDVEFQIQMWERVGDGDVGGE